MQLQLTENELKALIDSTIEQKYELDTYTLNEPIHAIVNPPASNEDLVVLEAHYRKKGIQMPPSYILFLKVYNGISNFLDDRDLTLLSANAVISGSFYVDEDDFPNLSQFIIAAGNTPEFISFDTSTAQDDGEMEVVHVGGDGDQARSANFLEFIDEHATYISDNLHLQQKDREDLEND